MPVTSTPSGAGLTAVRSRQRTFKCTRSRAPARAAAVAYAAAVPASTTVSATPARAAWGSHSRGVCDMTRMGTPMPASRSTNASGALATQSHSAPLEMHARATCGGTHPSLAPPRSPAAADTTTEPQHQHNRTTPQSGPPEQHHDRSHRPSPRGPAPSPGPSERAHYARSHPNQSVIMSSWHNNAGSPHRACHQDPPLSSSAPAPV